MVKFKLWEKLGGSMDPTGMESLGGGVRFGALRRGGGLGAKGGGSQPNPTCLPMYAKDLHRF